MFVVYDENSYIISSDSKELEDHISNYKIDMMEQVVSSIDYAVRNKFSSVEVFQFKDSNLVITISEKEFEDNLDNIYQVYMENQIYELCPRVIKVKRLLYLANKKKNEKK